MGTIKQHSSANRQTLHMCVIVHELRNNYYYIIIGNYIICCVLGIQNLTNYKY